MLHFGLEGIGPFVIYSGAVVAFLLSLFWRPSVGLYLIALTLPLQTWRYQLHDFPLGSQFIDILLLGTTIGSLARGWKIESEFIGSMFLLYAGFCYFSLCLGSFYLDAPLPFSLADPRFSNWKNYVEMFFLSLVITTVIKDTRQVKILIAVMCVAFLVVNRSFYGTMSDRDLSHFSYDLREAGPLGYAGVNGLAAFEAMFTAFLLGVYAYQTKTIVKLGLLGVIGSGLYGLLFSFSRGGYLAFIAALVVLGVLKERKLLVLVILILVGWQAILPASVQDRITMTTDDAAPGEEFDHSAQQRVTLWEDAMTVIKQNPVVGVGFNTYEFLDRVQSFSDTHNYYLKVFLETGVVGLLLFLWLIARMWGLTYLLFKSASDPFWRSLGLGFLALMASITVANFFGDRWTYQQVDGYIWVLLGCVIRGLIVVRENAVRGIEGGEDRPVAGEALWNKALTVRPGGQSDRSGDREPRLEAVGLVTLSRPQPL